MRVCLFSCCFQPQTALKTHGHRPADRKHEKRGEGAEKKKKKNEGWTEGGKKRKRKKGVEREKGEEVWKRGAREDESRGEKGWKNTARSMRRGKWKAKKGGGNER